MESARSTYEPPLAPAVADAMAILRLLRARAPERPGLSETARALELSKASCYRILQTLQGGGFVVQNPHDKTYALGPALIELGEAAAGDAYLLQLAREATSALAERTGFNTQAVQLTEDMHLVMVAESLSRRPVQISFALSQPRLARPPLGTTFFAWAAPAEVERWLDTASVEGSPLSPAERADYREYLGRVRRRGYHYTLSVAAGAEAGRRELEVWRERAAALGLEPQPAGEASPARPDRWTYPEPALPVPLITLVAPVFDHRGQVVLNLALTDFAGTILPERVPALAQEVRDASGTLTVAIGGRPPLEPIPIGVVAGEAVTGEPVRDVPAPGSAR
jgi:DNA-binding IclR family transcriptional regulator